MADEFQTGVCSGNWWNTSWSGLEKSPAPTSASPVTCSAAINDIESFGWTGEMGEGKEKGGEEPMGSGSGCSSITFQDTQKVPVSDSIVSSGFLMDSTLPVPGFGLSSQTMDWSQPSLSTRRTDQSSFHAIIQDDMSSRPYLTYMESSNQVHPGVEDSSANPFKDMNQAFLLEQQHLNSGNCALNGFPVVSGSYGGHTTLLHGLFEQDLKPQQSPFENQSLNYPSPMPYHLNSSTELTQPSPTKYPQFLKVLPSKQQSSQLHFSNSTPFWNASAAAVDEMRSGNYVIPQNQIMRPKFVEKPSCSNIPAKSNSGGAGDLNSAAKKSGNGPTFKKPRIETPSPLPTFKVRKEKLGDRITALQQLVSPFGKTDTASVLQEAIDYIKFLHDQVGVLSNPYLKNGPPMQHQQNSGKSKEQEGPKQDLRSRGLCLVPVSSTYPVTNEPTADFWTPTFGGAFR